MVFWMLLVLVVAALLGITARIAYCRGHADGCDDLIKVLLEKAGYSDLQMISDPDEFERRWYWGDE